MSQLLDYNYSLYYGTDEEYYEHIFLTIFDGNVMNMSFIFMEGNNGAIHADGSSRHDYYIIRISSFPYTLQSDLSIDGQVISYDEMVY